ncbi:DUF6287 domain-containing protein [Streptococcus hyovaginalis]|uniref:DUF6287 domain-containing protein n=1 Tax=Streptococcus hyovaginalis TaxID=149015 RepID=UPI003B3B2A34
MKKTIIYPFIATTVLATAALQTATVHAEDSATVSTTVTSNYQTLSNNLNEISKQAKEDVNNSTAPQLDKDSINTAIDSLLDKAQAELKSASEADYDVNGKLKNAFDEGRKKLERESKRAIRIGELNDEYNQVIKEAKEQNVSTDEIDAFDETFQSFFKTVKTSNDWGTIKGYGEYSQDTIDDFRSKNLTSNTSNSESSDEAFEAPEASEVTESSTSSSSSTKPTNSDKPEETSSSETQTEVATDEKASEDKANTSDEGFDFRKLVGTWRNGEGKTITINSDGTYYGDDNGLVGTNGSRYSDTDIWSVGIKSDFDIASGLLYFAPAGTAYPNVGQAKDASDISQDRFMLTNAYPEGTATNTYYRVAADSKPADKVGGQSGKTESSGDNNKPGNDDGKIDGLTDPTTPSQTDSSKPNNQNTKLKNKAFSLPSTGESQSIITIIIGLAIVIGVGLFTYKSKKHK